MPTNWLQNSTNPKLWNQITNLKYITLIMRTLCKYNTVQIIIILILIPDSWIYITNNPTGMVSHLWIIEIVVANNKLHDSFLNDYPVLQLSSHIFADIGTLPSYSSFRAQTRTYYISSIWGNYKIIQRATQSSIPPFSPPSMDVRSILPISEFGPSAGNLWRRGKVEPQTWPPEGSINAFVIDYWIQHSWNSFLIQEGSPFL